MVDFRLHELGWKDFENLCGDICSEVLGQSFEVFSAGPDAGRDGAFQGAAKSGGDYNFSGETVVQVKHVAQADKPYGFSQFEKEIPKVEKLVQKGLCENYILMTNAKISANNQAKVKEAVKNLNVQNVHVFGSDWITQKLTTNKRLRSLAPRIYGLGDLSEIIDERGYAQASQILESLKYDLDTFVPTRSYRSAVNSIAKHSVCLLLGAPAAGKTLIASSLALSAADQWGCRVVKIDRPEQFRDYWNPNDAKQFFWIDDAFGATQLDDSRVAEWNSSLRQLKAALKNGAKAVFTSRDYIWNEAQEKLKLREWASIDPAKVVVNVEDLSEEEREMILYNHIRMGAHPKEKKTQLKPHLPAVAAQPRFLPEVARRLGSPSFTHGVNFENKDSLLNFIQNPENFLLEILKELTAAQKVALMILVMESGRLNSPIHFDKPQLEILKAFGVSEASVRHAFDHLNGSLTKITRDEKGRNYWEPRHPTITDATTTFLVEKSELLETYIRLAKPTRLFNEISCGVYRKGSTGVPDSLYNDVIPRIADLTLFKQSEMDRLIEFLVYRCDDEFIMQFLDYSPNFLSHIYTLRPFLASNMNFIKLCAKTVDLRPLNEELLKRFTEDLYSDAVEWADSALVKSNEVIRILGEERADQIVERIVEDFRYYHDDIATVWRDNFDPSSHFSVDDYLVPFKEFLTGYGLSEEDYVEDLLNQLDCDLQEILENSVPPEEYWGASDNPPLREGPAPTKRERSIFDDVDAS